MRSVLVIVALSSVALADKPAPPKPSKEAVAALRAGRALQAKKKLTQALAAFEKGIAVAPDDATLLGEAGWTAFLAKDLDKAEQYTRKAIASQAAPAVLGAALYNLGQIEEARKQPQAAIAAYAESLRARPNGVVRARLVELDPKLAATFDPFAPVKLAGPFTSIEDFCKKQPKGENDLFGEALQCSCGSRIKPASAKPAAPFERIEMFQHECISPDPSNPNGGFGHTQYHLGVKTGAGWFIANVDDLGFNRHCDRELAFDSIAMERVANQPRAMIRYNANGDCAGGAQAEEWHSDSLVVLGVGPSGIPSATPRIRVVLHEEDTSFDSSPEAHTVSQDIALAPSWDTDGALQLSGKTKGLDRNEATNATTKHVLVFP